MPEQLVEIAWYVGSVVALIFVLVLLGFFLQALQAYSKRLEIELGKLDSNSVVIAFGESTTGRYINEMLHNTLPKIDQVSDPAIRSIMAIPIVAAMKELKLIDDEKVVGLTTAFFNRAILLTNGVIDDFGTTTTSSDVPGALG